MNRKIVFFTALIGGFFNFCLGQEVEDKEDYTSLSLEDLLNIQIVSASKSQESVLDAFSNITVISAKQIREWGSRDIKDVLRRVAGYQVIADRDEWVFGARGNVSDNNQKYLILVDGVRTNSVENFGPGNYIELPNDLSNVKQLEIIRGPGSIVWGTDALAGVINIITFDGKDLKERSSQASMRAGTDGLFVTNFQVGDEIMENVSYAVMGSFSMRKGTDGIEQYAATGLPDMDENFGNTTHPFGTYNTILDRHRPGYMLQLKSQIGENITFNAQTFETEVFTRHYEWNSPNGAREHYFSTRKQFAQVNYNKVLGANTDFTYNVGTGLNIAAYKPFKLGGNPLSNLLSMTWRDRFVFSNVAIAKPLTEQLKLSAGFGYQYTKAGPNPRIQAVDPDNPQAPLTGFWFDRPIDDSQITSYLLFNWNVSELLSFSLGSGFGYNDKRGSDAFNATPRIGVIVNPIENGAIKLLYNRGFLRPSNLQNSSASNQTASLQSETMDQYDLIWLHKTGSFSYSINAYYQNLNGFINIISGTAISGFSNAGDYSSKGLEFEGSYVLADGKSTIWSNFSMSKPEGDNFSEDLNYNDQRVDLNGEQLSYSQLTANLGSTYYLSDRFFVSPAFRFVKATKYRLDPATSRVTDVEANYEETPDFLYIDLNIGLDASDKLSFQLYFDNITDITTPTHLSVWNGTIEQAGFFSSLKLNYKF